MRRFKRIWKLSRLPLLPPPIPGSKPYLSTIRSTNSTSSSSEDVRKLTVIREISPSLGVAHLPVPPNQKYFYTSRYQKILSRKFWQRHHARCTTSTNTEMLDGCLISPGFMGEINSVSSSSGSSGHRDSKLVQTSTTSLEDSSSEGNVHSPRHFTIEMTAAMKQPVKESPL